ncbi:alpha/beta hydrolase [Aquabacterium humicola]|uniref:alpha/beta hydrolase n=1 Tax=Aquabacterium humicola TaxID=3237377 RepID=UPI002543307C|nr:alpha/beta fold hydrolase [Rubrivivax pictus]
MKVIAGLIGWLLLVAVLAYGALCLAMALMQDSLLYFPTPPSKRAYATLRVDGIELRYAEQPRGGERALLYLGGNAEDPSLALAGFADAFPGHAVYGLHYRGYAGSEGLPGEDALHADARALFDALRHRHPRITVVGRSLGTALAVRLAAERAVERLVLITPYDSIAAVAARHYPWLPVRFLLRDRYEAWRDAPRVRAPALLLLAGDDTLIPPQHGHALAGHFASGVAKVRVLRGTDHNSIGDAPAYWQALRELQTAP